MFILSVLGCVPCAQPRKISGRQIAANIGADNCTLPARPTFQKRPHHSSSYLCCLYLTSFRYFIGVAAYLYLIGQVYERPCAKKAGKCAISEKLMILEENRFENILASLRVRKGWTQEDAVAHIKDIGNGISRSTYIGLETGK